MVIVRCRRTLLLAGWIVLLSLWSALPLPGRPAPLPSVQAAASPCTWIQPTPGVLTDTHAYYWIMFLSAPPSVALVISGTYPAARYASLQAYTASGAFLAGLDDQAFPATLGSVNPFVTGSARGRGSYRVSLLFQPAPPAPGPGVLYAAVPASTTVALVYRLYLPDAGATVQGNVPLPAVTARSRVSGLAVPCPEVAPPHAGAPPSAGPAATPSITMTAGFTRVSGLELGGYGNVDAAYLQATLLPSPNLYVVRFTAPTTPHTLGGGSITPAQLRYWSLCVYTAAQWPYGCLADEQAPTNAAGAVTVVLGPTGSRPANATVGAGVVWVDLGATPAAYGLLLRHLLPASTFGGSAFAVPLDAAPSPYMGLYTPQLAMCSTAQFELDDCAPAA